MRKTIAKKLVTMCALILAAGVAMPAMAAVTSHEGFVSGPLKTGPDATKQCLECHEKEATDFMKTTHWTWSSLQDLNGRTVQRGKKNAINNYCTSINANWDWCTNCHAGYGWHDKNFDFTDKTRVDCLVCHDTTGSYNKVGSGAGEPAERVDLLYVAQNVGKPSRVTCGYCHFYGGGGDAVKHGDLDSTMEFPERNIDVHMAVDGPDMTCQECHKTTDHRISGHALGASPGGESVKEAHFGCENCHGEEPHAQSRLNAHIDTVACQTCHIPYFAKEVPTKLSWDWSTAGQEGHEETLDQYGKHTYLKSKGSFVYGKMVAPEYAWYNGKADAYMEGDKMDPNKVTKLAYPLGDIKDKKAKLYPFKVHRGKQIYDKKFKYFITAKTYGEGGYWRDFDWDKAARLGMKESGLEFSGEYGFAPTEMYWRLNHMVSPKEDSLTCLECHGDNGRMKWKDLGYKGDPMDNPKWAKNR